MDNKIIISNIQHFSLSDGEGIRTTVFLKGCSLKCPWCANPENINSYIEKYYDEENDEYGTFGYEITLSELYDDLIKDKVYYSNGGGVTFSGGEPLLWIDKLEPLLKKLKNEKINICFETSLYVSNKSVKKAIQYADYIITDLKILDNNLAKNVLKNDLNIYLENIDFLFDNYDKKNILIRIPVSKEYVLTNKDKYREFLHKYRPNKVEIFKLHNLGEKKYRVLDRSITQFEDIQDNEIKEFKEYLDKICKVDILKI
ncbi:MAG: radical SAM protein [Bacilli bacterium]|nr:radical SAM protein [Bacilli bacterium]